MSRSRRGELIDQALQRVGNNSPSLKIQARIRLNRILQDLYQGWDWPFLWFITDVSLPPTGQFDLGSIHPTHRFVKPEDDQSLSLLTQTGSYHPIQEVDHKTFSDRMRHYAGTATSYGRPILWTIYYATSGPLGPTGHFHPRPETTLSGRLRCKLIPPDLPIDATVEDATYDNDVPDFPWDSFLTDALVEWAMTYEVDPRRAEQLTINASVLEHLRGATWPERSFPSTVQLDPMFFSTPTWGSGRD